MQFTAAIDRLYRLDPLPGFATMCTRVHRQRAADGSRNPGEKLGRSELPANALPGQLSAGNAGTGPDTLITRTFDVL